MDRLFIVPHSHYDAEVFKTREEYLEWGYSIIIDVLKMLKKHRNYRFVLDQSAYIKPFLEKYTELRGSFLEMVQCGRLEIVCGMYIMPDVNIPSGESLIRQILLGKGFCKNELKVDVKTGWMIDTFGHHPQIPQIMKKSGFDYYVFSRVADMKNSEFLWKGLDGTMILSHWMPYHYGVFYNSPVYLQGFSEFAEDRYMKLKEYAATEDIIAFEGADFNLPVEHTPDCVFGYNEKPCRRIELKLATPMEFFKEIEKNTDRLNTVSGEFNPIFQGCYSARIDVKQWNRHMENLLITGEIFDSILYGLKGKSRADYINDAWEPVLFNQFHDVICGVQVDKVFENVILRYEQSKFLAKRALEEDIEEIVTQIDTSGEGISIVVFNRLNWERIDKVETVIAFDEGDVFDVSITDCENRFMPLQLDDVVQYPNGSIKQAKLLFIAKIPSLGYEVFTVLRNVKNPVKNVFRTGKWYGTDELNEGILENEFYRIRVNLWNGAVKSIILKETEEEFVNQDIPYCNMLVKECDNGDFWEIGTPLRGSVNRPLNRVFPLPQTGNAFLSVQGGGSTGINEGNVRTDFHFTQKSSYGEFTTSVRLYSGLRRIEINTGLTNKEENVRYRIAFPVSIINGKVTHEIPFGSIERPEGEFPAQNWIDYSDSCKGIGLLNCGLPGNAVVNDTMFLSVLKCTSFVSYGDVGGFSHSTPASGGFEKGKEHRYLYALLPHSGNWKDAELYRHGLELNNPFIVRKTPCKKGTLPKRKSFVSIDKSNIVITCLKRSGSSIILRAYEAAGIGTGGVKLNFDWKIRDVNEVNLIEENIKDAGEIAIDSNNMTFDMEPFQIKTFKIELL